MTTDHPSPMHTSPIKTWRAEAGLTQAQLAREAGVSVMTITRTEQLLYSEPSASIVRVFIDRAVGPFYVDSVQPWKPYITQYRLAQQAIRAETDWSQGSIIACNVALATETHPFLWWRESLGFNERLTFCRAACVPPPQVLHYETARQRTMPKVIRAALVPFLDSGYITSLSKAAEGYYDAVNE